MTAKLDREKEDDLDSLSFSATKRLLGKICKFLGFKLSHRPFYTNLTWLLNVDYDTVVFLDGRNRDEFLTAKDLLRGILNSKIFKLRTISVFNDDNDNKIIPNPFYSLDLCTLKIKLDLLSLG